MGRIALVLGILLLLGTAARAEETKLVTVVAPVKDGFAISVDLPVSPDWKRVLSSNAYWSYVGVEWQGAHKGHSAPRIQVGASVSRRSYSFDKVIDNMNNRIKNTVIIVHEKGIDNTLGQETFYYLNSDVDCYSGGQKLRCTKPFRITYATSMHDRVFVEIGLSTKDAEDFEKHRPLLERIAKTIKLIPESELDPATTSTAYSSPGVTTSKRRGHYLENHIEILLPPGWTAEETDVRHATATNERGRLQVVFSPDNPSPGPSEPYEVFYVIAEGLPYTVLTKSDYLAAGNHYVSSVLKERTKLETPGSAALPDGSSAMHGFCASNAKTRYSDGTGGTHVSTYEGKNADGRKLKLRIYTAGGITQVCNVVYVADPETFDSAQERIDALVKSLQIVTFDPQLLRKYQ